MDDFILQSHFIQEQMWQRLNFRICMSKVIFDGEKRPLGRFLPSFDPCERINFLLSAVLFTFFLVRNIVLLSKIYPFFKLLKVVFFLRMMFFHFWPNARELSFHYLRVDLLSKKTYFLSTFSNPGWTKNTIYCGMMTDNRSCDGQTLICRSKTN